MDVTIEALSPDAQPDRWDALVDRAAGTHPLYRATALERQAAVTGTTSTYLVGYVGEEPIGLFPVFEYRRGPFSAAFSPPPRSWTSYLGPTTIETGGMKRRTADRRTGSFVSACLEWIGRELSPLYSRYVLTMSDIRPFLDAGFDAEPSFTYVVSLDDPPETLLGRLSADARRKIKRGPGDAVVEEGSGAAVEAIVEQVRDRYAAQGRSFHLTPGYVRSLHEEVGADAIRPYVCRRGERILGGILVLESDDTRYRWLGGVKPDDDVDVPVNELLDWRVMTDGIDRGIDRYDLVGAGVSSINRYKAKYNPDLETYHTLTSGSFGLDLAIDRYRASS